MYRFFNRNPLFFSFLFPAITDGIVTLLGQDAIFWQNYQTVNEASPAYFFLVIHPALYIIGSIIWFVFLFWLMKKLKHPLNLVLALAFIAGHSWGSSSWIIKMMKTVGLFVAPDRFSLLMGWTVLILYYVLIGVLAGICIDRYFKEKYKA